MGAASKGGIRNFKKVKLEIENKKKAPQKALNATLKDVKARAPGWVAKEITAVYGVKKSEVQDGTLGKVKVEGDSLQTARIVYTGRPLTPTHFGMTPKSPGSNAYTLKASFIKGQKATLGKVKKLNKKQRAALAKNFRGEGTRSSDRSPIMLMRTGNTRADGTNYIPFQRKSTRRNDIEAIKTVSLPQMVSGHRTAPQISQAINENVQKRLEHHMKRNGL